VVEGRSSKSKKPSQASFVRRSWKWLSAAVLAALAAVIAGYVADANHWLQSKVVGARPALSVVVTMKSPARVCDGQTGWVFPVKPAALPVPSLAAPIDQWASQNGGVPASGNYVTAVLQPPAGTTVVVTDIRVEVVDREPARRSGTHPVLGGGCGGLVPMLFKANLDASPVRVIATAGRDIAGRRIPPIPLPHTVSERSPEEWQIAAVTSTCDCDWVAYIDYTADGHSGQSRIDNHGRPFRVTSDRDAVNVIRDCSTEKCKWTELP
jgi:hypothetical protein